MDVLFYGWLVFGVIARRHTW